MHPCMYAQNGWSALHWASGSGYTGVVTVLLDHGADVHAVDKVHYVYMLVPNACMHPAPCVCSL